MELNKIHNSDCRTGIKTLPDNSVDCCVTSPPYYGLRNYGVDGQIGLEETPEAYIARLVEVFMEVYRIIDIKMRMLKIPELKRIMGFPEDYTLIGTEDIVGYVKEHKKEISDAFLSFAYGGINQRKQYDAAIEAITDPEKLKQFKAQHEDIQRTSMSRWVNYAWNLGNKLKNNENII
jgi:hypothetical protein